MAQKFFCDVCDVLIKDGELTGEFASVEYNFSGKKVSTDQPYVRMAYLFCQNHRDEIKKKVVELMDESRKENGK